MNQTAVQNLSFSNLRARVRLQRGLAFGVIIVTALLAFEIFNYSTTDFALGDLLGDLTFLGMPWSTILALAFCGIDFAGIARLFTPEVGADEPNEVWYLFGAWLLAASMNAMLTWWGVSIAIIEHQSLGDAVIARATLLRVVPIFVAVLVWLIRVLIIGTFSVAGDRLFSQGNRQTSANRRTLSLRPVNSSALTPREAIQAASFHSAPKSASKERSFARPEPTFRPTSMITPPPPNGGSSHQAGS
jgi:hypothetical protein